MKKVFAIALIVIVFLHQVVLLNNLTNERIPDITTHFLVSFHKNPALDIIQWISMHFSPVSKHLFADPLHQQETISPKCSSLFLSKWNRIRFVQYVYAGLKINNSGTIDVYDYLFTEEILIPPKRLQFIYTTVSL